MANINGFGRFQNERDGGGGGRLPGGLGSGMASLEGTGLPLVEQTPLNKNPRDENLWDMCKFSLCSAFSLKSVVVGISCLNLFLWIVSLLFSKHLIGTFLQPSGDSLILMGAKDNARIQQWQLHRLIFSCFLHGSFMHIFVSIITLMIFGSPLEKKLGWIKFLGLYVVFSVGGAIFSSLVTDKMTVGGTASVFGIVGVFLGFVIVNWDALEAFGIMRCFLMIACILYTLMLTFATVNLNIYVDNYGHMGAFLIGLISSTFAVPRMNGEVSKMTYYIGIALVLGFLILGFVLIMFVRTYSGIYVQPVLV